MIFFADTSNFDGTMCMGHPMKVNTKHFWFEFSDERFNIKALVTQHQKRNVDCTNLIVKSLEIFPDGTEPQRVCFKNCR